VHAHYGFEAFLLQPERHQSNNQKKKKKFNEIQDTFLPKQNIFGKYFTSEEDVILSSI
jgi:hypothetical protein